MGEPEQITKKSHRGESKSHKTKSSKKKVKFNKSDLLEILRKYAQICEHNIKVKEIIKYETYKEGYYKKVKEKLKEHKNNIKDWSPAECLATYIYIVSMYTDKTSYEYNFKNSPANQSGAFKDFYDEVIEKIPADQQKGPNKDPLYRIFNRVTKLHNSNDFNDYNAYNEIVKYAKNAEGKSPEELEAKREQRIEKESQKLKEMFDTINAKIEEMGEFNYEKINEIIKESMNEYKQYGSRGFTIARSYLNKYLYAGTSKFNKKIEKYDSKEEHTEIEKKVNDYLNEFMDLFNQKYHKEYLKNELKTLIEGSFGNIKELSRENVSSRNASSAENATRELMTTIFKLKKEIRKVEGLTEEQKRSFNEELDFLHDFSRGVILNFVFVLRKYLDEGIDISPLVKLKSGKFDFNSKFMGDKSYYYIPTTKIDSSRVLYLEEAFKPLFECLNVMYQEACSGKTIDVLDKDNERKLRLGRWELKDWLENGSSSDIILYPARYRPKWIGGTESHTIKFYKTGEYYIYDIGETLGLNYSVGDKYDDKKGEHPFFLAVEDVFKVSKSFLSNIGNWNRALYHRSLLSGTPFFKLNFKWHKKLSKKLQMKEIYFNPIPTGDTYLQLFRIEDFISEGSLRTVKHVGHQRYND